MELLTPDQQRAHLADQVSEIKAICNSSAFHGTRYTCGFTKKKKATRNVPRGVVEGERGVQNFIAIRANGSGITCLDFSQSGLGKGMTGPHGKVKVLLGV